MRNTFLVAVLALMAASTHALVLAGTCEKSDLPETQCNLQVDKVHPTQFSVGSVALGCKAASISKKSRKKLKKYLHARKNLIPVVVGPSGNFYITDRHHFSTALYRAESSAWGNQQKILQILIVENYNNKYTSWGQFWEAMQKQGRSYNFDNKGVPDMNYALLPKTVGGLLNDPYRTLSLWVRESCGYVKKGKKQCDDFRTNHPHKAPLFMELYWGDFFRHHLPMTIAGLEVCKSIPYSPTCLSDEVGQLKTLYKKAIILAASEQAKNYFEDLNLDPWTFGYNPAGEHLELKWGDPRDACAEPVMSR